MIRKQLFFIMMISLNAIFHYANAQSMKTSWIGSSTDTLTQSNTWHCFRKNFKLSEVPVSAIARIAVDTRYYLWLNDSLVVIEGGLKRGPNPSDTYFDEVNLSPFLRKGENNISILVWYWGGKGFSHNSSGRCGLWFCGNFDGQEIVSDESWKAIQHPAYGPSNRPIPNYRLSEQNLFFDAQKDIPGWNLQSFNDQLWATAIEIGEAPVKPWNQLVKRPIPLFRDYGYKDYVSTHREGDVVYCQLPYDCHASPYLKIKAPAGNKIFIRSDTYYMGAIGTDSLYTLCSDYITKEGVQEFENYNWITGHIIKYTIPKDVEIISLKYRETGYSTDFAGSFKCDDPFYNKLWVKATRSLYVNMGDTYTDCPDRERAQWAGDATLDMEQSFYALDSRSWALGRKLYLDLVNWQKPDGVIYNTVPEKDRTQEVPAHSLMPMAESWEYFKFTRDTALLKAIYEPFKKYITLWKLKDNGELEYRPGGWDWGDWGENVDFVLIQHGWYLKCLQTMEKIATLIGKTEEAAMFKAKSQKMVLFLNSPDCWNGEAYRFKLYKGETDDRANALMIITDVADPMKWEKLKTVFATQFHSSPWMEKFVLESLIKMGQPGLALKRMKKRYQAMVESEFSTLWELWSYDKNEVAEHGNSGNNHGWSGGPLILLSKYFAGIEPVEELSGTYNVFPDLSILKTINANFPVKDGVLQLNACNTDNNTSIEVVVPDKIAAIVGIKKCKEVILNGLFIYKNREFIQNQTVIFLGEKDNLLLFKVSKGKYKFIAN